MRFLGGSIKAWRWYVAKKKKQTNKQTTNQTNKQTRKMTIIQITKDEIIIRKHSLVCWSEVDARLERLELSDNAMTVVYSRPCLGCLLQTLQALTASIHTATVVRMEAIKTGHARCNRPGWYFRSPLKNISGRAFNSVKRFSTHASIQWVIHPDSWFVKWCGEWNQTPVIER